MKRIQRFICVVLGCAVGLTFRLASAQTPATMPTSMPTALLGSVEFKPSPERPVGWRGDWTGNYPGAKPPTEWALRIKTGVEELRCQSAAPAGDAPSGEELSLGRIEDWMVLGPFTPKDPATGLDEEFIKDEATVVPDLSQKVGDVAWKHYHSGGENQDGTSGAPGLDFHLALGELTQVVAYGTTQIFSPRPMKVKIVLGITNGMKVWLNGAVLFNDKKAPYGSNKVCNVELQKGWNRLTCKSISGSGKYAGEVAPKWKFFAAIQGTDSPTLGEVKNIRWMARMPATTISSPIIVGDRVYVNSDYSDLICLNKADGKVLWVRSNLFYDSLADSAKSDPMFKEKIDPEVAQLKKINDDLPAQINALLPMPGAAPTTQEAALATAFVNKAKLERDIDFLLQKVDGKNYKTPYNQHCGTSNGTPLTDGTHVWVADGGGIYEGVMTVACYDLDGNRQWIQGFLAPAGEHGDHASLILSGDKVVLGYNKFIKAFDAQTGKMAYEQEMPSKLGGAGPLPLKIAGKEIIYMAVGDVFSSDGKVLYQAAEGLFGPTWLPGTSDGDTVYGINLERGSILKAVKLSANGDSIKSVQNWENKNLFPGLQSPRSYVGMYCASPLFHDGLVYIVTEGGILTVVNAADGTVAYTKVIADLRPQLAWVIHPGVCGSPTFAGDYIYISGDNGWIMVIKPGREFNMVALNKVDVIGGETWSTPVFEGNRMYYRTPEYLYCIGEN